MIQCSDHASFSAAGYQSAFTIGESFLHSASGQAPDINLANSTPLAESTFEDSDKHIHSTGDTMDYDEFSFDHMKEFSKLAIAFGVELSGHKSK